VFCISVKVKLSVPLLCVCVHSTWKGRPRNDLYCVGWDVKPYSLTHSSFTAFLAGSVFCLPTRLLFMIASFSRIYMSQGSVAT